MQIEVVVVSYENEFWFEFEGFKFDTLYAFWELDRRKVQVVRNGATIATGRVSEARGEPVFNDYGTGKDIVLKGSALHAEKFRLSDYLVLDIPDGFNLSNHLVESCQFLGAVIASMPVGQTMTLGEAKRKIVAELSKEVPDTPIRILRFRRHK
ncbi:MAG: hypothetical protein AAB392_00105 [Patescibacteria group bacterium]